MLYAKVSCCQVPEIQYCPPGSCSYDHDPIEPLLPGCRCLRRNMSMAYVFGPIAFDTRLRVHGYLDKKHWTLRGYVSIMFVTTCRLES